MKKFIISIIISLVFILNSFAYDLTEQDKENIEKFNQRIEKIISEKGENYRDIFIEKLRNYNKKIKNEKGKLYINYIIIGILRNKNNLANDTKIIKDININLDNNLENTLKNIVNSPDNMRDILLKIPREDRKKVCFEIMNRYKEKDPKLAYYSADCLLGNGYGKLAIPFFVEFQLNGNNEKYLNGRMGYEWLHDGNWYNLTFDEYSEMVGGDGKKELYEWVGEEMQKEIQIRINNPEKYNIDKKILDEILTGMVKKELKIWEKTLTKDEVQQLISCKEQSTAKNFANINGYQCEAFPEIAGKGDFYVANCQKMDITGKELIECEN